MKKSKIVNKMGLKEVKKELLKNCDKKLLHRYGELIRKEHAVDIFEELKEEKQLDDFLESIAWLKEEGYDVDPEPYDYCDAFYNSAHSYQIHELDAEKIFKGKKYSLRVRFIEELKFLQLTFEKRLYMSISGE